MWWWWWWWTIIWRWYLFFSLIKLFQFKKWFQCWCAWFFHLLRQFSNVYLWKMSYFCYLKFINIKTKKNNLTERRLVFPFFKFCCCFPIVLMLIMMMIIVMVLLMAAMVVVLFRCYAWAFQKTHWHHQHWRRRRHGFISHFNHESIMNEWFGW